MVERRFNVKSPLRPIFHEYFPTLNSWEIEDRLRILPPHLATHLTATNIRAYNQINGTKWWRWYKAQRPEAQAGMLSEVLHSVGFDLRTVEAMVTVDRRLFCEKRYEKLAWLNWTIPLRRGSALSAPGIVAYYLEVLRSFHSPKNVAEIGLGSGYHTAVMASLFPGIRVVGYEPIALLAETARESLARLAIDVEIRQEPFPFRQAARESYDYVFATTSLPFDARDLVAQSLTHGGFATIVRPLTAKEFAARPRDSWLQGLYPTYQSYRFSDGWATTCAVTSFACSVNDTERRMQDAAVLYGVTFVPWRRETALDPGPGRNAPLDALLIGS